MSVPADQVIPICVDTIFERAETDPFLIQADPDQVQWTSEGQRMLLSRLQDLSCYFLQVSDVDTEVVASDLYLFNGTGLIQAIRAFAAISDALANPTFFEDAIASPLNQGPVTDEDEDNFFTALLSGLKTSEQ